jgi:aminoglycoside phosphotransferase (APT) family kinase protein
MRESTQNQISSELNGDFDYSKIDEGLNTLYRVNFGKENMILKIHTNQEVDHNYFRAEPILYQLLREKSSVQVPEIILKNFSSAKSGRDFYLMEEIDGINAANAKDDLNFSSLEKIINNYGRVLGSLHNFDHDMNAYGDIIYSNGDLKVEGSDSWLESQREKVEAWINKIERKWDEPPEIGFPSAKISQLIPENPEKTLMHVDNRMDNIIIEDNQIKGFIDWEGARIGHSYYDLARAEYLLIDWDLYEISESEKESLRQRLYDGYRETNEIDSSYFGVRDLYRYMTAIWVAAGFPNWGSDFDEETYEFMRSRILKKIKEENKWA